jgi:hypothetical protein
MMVLGHGARKKWSSFKDRAWTNNNATQLLRADKDTETLNDEKSLPKEITKRC